ncbi:lysine exporter LysO family protein [Marinitoga arctica]
MILLISSVVAGIISGYFININIPDNLITLLLMALVFSVGVDIGSEEKILLKLKISLKIIFIQSFLVIIGSLVFGGFVSFFTQLNFKEAMGAAAGMGWYSLSGVMISSIYSPFLGAVAFLSNVFREILGILFIPLYVKISQHGAIGIAGAPSMDTLLGIVSKSVNRDKVLISFGQGVILSVVIPILITLIF